MCVERNGALTPWIKSRIKLLKPTLSLACCATMSQVYLSGSTAVDSPFQHQHRLFNMHMTQTKRQATSCVRMGSCRKEKAHPIAQKPSTYTSALTFGNSWRATTARRPACQASARPRPANVRRATFMPPRTPSLSPVLGQSGPKHHINYRERDTQGEDI